MINKNYTIYGLSAVACVLGAVYFTIPSKTQAEDKIINNKVQIKQKEENLVKLPKLEQQNYQILNDRIVKLTKELNILKSSNSINASKSEYANLYAELEKLKAINERLKTKNNELSHKLSNESLLVNENSKNSYEKLIEKLNNELAEFRSENDTLKLNLNDKENIVKNLNSLIGTLSNQKQMDEFEHDSQARKLQQDLEDAKAKIQANMKNYNDLLKENDVLKQRIKSLSELEIANTKLNENINELNLKNLELANDLKVATKLSEGLKNAKNADLTKLNLDNKNLLAKLDESKTSILKLTQLNEELKQKVSKLNELEKEKEEIKNEMFQAKLSLENYKNEQTQAMKKLSDKSQLSIDKLSAELNNLNEANKNLKQKNSENLASLKELKTQNTQLQSSLAKQEKTLNKVNNDLGLKNIELAKLTKVKEELKQKLEDSKKETIELTAKLNTLNSEFLSYKNQSISDKKNNAKSSNEKLQASVKAYDELNTKYLNLKEDFDTKSIQLDQAKKEKLALDGEIEQLKLTISNDKNAEKVIALEEEKDRLLKRLNELNLKILNNYNQENSDLVSKKEQILKLQKQLELAQKNSELNTASLKLQDTLMCDDIKSGMVTLTKSCALKLDKFLAQYNKNYLYEITPIIDNGGFRSLSVIDGIHMASSEVKRLTRLANFGLSKDRTKSAATYIKSKVPNALISSSLEPEYSKNGKKGFILRVYK